MFDELVLIQTAIVKNEFGKQQSIASKKTTIPIQVNSVGQNEHFAAKEHNLKATYKMETSKLNYQNENYAIYQGVTYMIYRTFLQGNSIYLYLAETNEQF